MKDNRKKLGIDVDGVLANFIEAYHSIAETVTQRVITEEPADWDWSNWGLTATQDSEVWRRIIATPNFWITLSRCPGAKPLDLLTLDRKCCLYFVTTRVPTEGLPTEVQTALWLQRSFALVHPTVIVTKNKGLVAKALNLDAFIDDKPENLIDVFQESTARCYLHDASYNRSDVVKGFGKLPAERVTDFSEFAKIYG